jgi:glucose-1-phosphatase
LSKTRWLLLDMGKVLVDFDFRNLSRRMQALAGLEAAQLQAAFMDKNLALRYESGELSDAEFHQEICRRLGRSILFRDFADAWNSIFLPEPLLPDELLAALAGNVDLWVLSNTNGLHFTYILEHYAFTRHFKGFVVSFEAGSLKPDPRIFRYALCKAAASEAGTLFVDDALPNVEAALRLGIDAFQFLGAGQFVRELSTRGLL